MRSNTDLGLGYTTESRFNRDQEQEIDYRQFPEEN
jgi:hypothetical protein